MSEVDVMWVGLSAKNDKTGHVLPPLDANSNSGKVISMIEAQHEELVFYRTNLVKHAPLDDHGKLRYPNSSEMESSMPDLIREVQKYRPKMIFLLGGQMSKFVQSYLEQNNINVSAMVYEIYHPSYIYIYKRKQMREYICEVSKKIEALTF